MLKEFIDRVRQTSVMVGATLDPAAAYFIKRHEDARCVGPRSCRGALLLASALRTILRSPAFTIGLEDDPDHTLAKHQMKAFGGVVAIDLVGGEGEVEKFFNSLRLVRTAPSLGGVETLASYPIYSSHAGFSDEQLKAAGVSPATVRFALGIEAAADIIADVTQSLSVI